MAYLWFVESRKTRDQAVRSSQQRTYSLCSFSIIDIKFYCTFYLTIFLKRTLILFGLGFLGVPRPGDGGGGWVVGGLQKSPLHKSESINAIDMKLGG